MEGNGNMEGLSQSYQEPVNVKQVAFKELEEIRGAGMPKNIDLIPGCSFRIVSKIRKNKEKYKRYIGTY